jgi:hypothetical protein
VPFTADVISHLMRELASTTNEIGKNKVKNKEKSKSEKTVTNGLSLAKGHTVNLSSADVEIILKKILNLNDFIRVIEPSK